MKRLLLLLTLALATASTCRADWSLFERRLGLFIHWGIYSVGAWHEQQQMRLDVPREEYERLATRFTAEKFSADAFIDAAESLGAEYIVITAKHHDGFCLWDTATTDYKVTKTPCGRDVLKELSEACARRGMKLGFYYSNPDWHQKNAYNAKSTHQLHGGPQPGDAPDMAKYRAYVKAQVTELCTNYGPLVCFFWDIPTKIDAPEMNALVRSLQPGIKINDRGWGSDGDYSTPERDVPPTAAFSRPTEACDSVDAESWGYRANADYRTRGYLTRAIDAILAKGGNFLLNVGPRADGTIPSESLELLASVGAWYRTVRESYRGVETVTNVVPDAAIVTTRRGDTLYLHLTRGLDRSGLNLGPWQTLPKSATLLNRTQPLAAEIVPMPSNIERVRQPSLHVSGLPADSLANEGVVIRLDGCPAERKN